MKLMSKLTAAAVLLCAPFTSTFAVDPTEEVILLWSEGEDISPGTERLIFSSYEAAGGPKLIGGADTTNTLPGSTEGMLKCEGKVRIVVRPAAGGAPLFVTNPVTKVTSLQFPDPTLSANQCGGINHTNYESNDEFHGCPSPGFENCFGACFDPNVEDICEDIIEPDDISGGGMAQGSSDKLVVIGSQVVAEYFQNDTDNDVSVYAIQVYSQTGTRLWYKTFNGTASDGFELLADLSGVGDFLNNDGVDELRIARDKEFPNVWKHKYQYYDIDTGLQIGNAITFDVTKP